MEPHPDFREVNISLPRAWLNVGLRVEGVLVVLVVVDVDCSLLAADCDSLLLLLLLLFCDDSKFLATASLVNSNADVKLSFSLVAAALAVASSSLLSPPVLVLPVLPVLVAVGFVLSCLTCAVARCVTASPVRSNDTMRRSLNVDVAAKNGFDDDEDAAAAASVVVDVVVLPSFPSPVVLLLAVDGIFAIVGLLEPLVVVLLFVSLVGSPEKGFVVGRRFVHILRQKSNYVSSVSFSSL